MRRERVGEGEKRSTTRPREARSSQEGKREQRERMTEVADLYRNKKVGKGDKVPGLEMFRLGVVEWDDMSGLTGTK